MIPALPLTNEEERLQALFSQDILDTAEEEDFNELVKLAAELCGTEIALISLVDDRRQWFKAARGLAAKETDRDLAFCAHAIWDNRIFEINDASKDERFHDNPLVTGEPYIRFYAGQPIVSSDGHKLGTLCVIDSQPKQLTSSQREILRILAKQIEKQFILRAKIKNLGQAIEIIQQQKDSLKTLGENKDQILSIVCHDLRSPLGTIQSVMELFEENIIDLESAVNLMRDVNPLICKMSSQLEQVLSWAQDQMQTTVVNLVEVPLYPLTMESINWVDDRAKLKGLKLEIDMDKGITALGNYEYIKIVLRNLLSNAVKYCRHQDQIVVFADPIPGQLLIKLGVKDTGLGISPPSLEKLKNNIFNSSTLGTNQEEGNGLGLLLCQTYLHKINSSLVIESEWKKGSEFSFTLPIAEIPNT